MALGYILIASSDPGDETQPVAIDTVAGLGAVQIVKVAYGDEDEGTLVSEATPLPVVVY